MKKHQWLCHLGTVSIGLFNNKEEDDKDQVMDHLGFMSQLLHHEDKDDDFIVPDEPPSLLLDEKVPPIGIGMAIYGDF
jgi:hypothetical protein